MTDEEPMVVIVDAESGEEELRPMNDEEKEQLQKDKEEGEQKVAQEEQEEAAKQEAISIVQAKAEEDPAFAALARLMGIGV